MRETRYILATILSLLVVYFLFALFNDLMHVLFVMVFFLFFRGWVDQLND